MGKKISGAPTTGSNHRSRRGKGEGSRSKDVRALHRRRDRNAIERMDGAERPDSVISDEGDREDQLSSGM
jgi:pre-rRNA-processing protein TSR3